MMSTVVQSMKARLGSDLVKIMGEKGFVLVDFPAISHKELHVGQVHSVVILMGFPIFIPTPCKEKEVEICIFGTFQIQ